MRIVYLLFALIFLGLGVIGIVLPVLPTTPFFLLTTVFFAKSSPRFHGWFIQTRLYDKYLKSFIETRSMTKRQKWSLMIFVDIICIVSFILISSWVVRIILILCEIGKYYYFTKYVKTL